MRSNQRFEPTAASVPLAVPSSLRSSAAAQARRWASRRGGVLTVRQKVVVLCVFLATGLVLMLAQRASTKHGEQECKAQCDAVGKDHVYAPAGTMGRSAEEGSSYPPTSCRCIARRSTPGHPQVTK
jgi:hypothetical protein